LVVVAEEGKKMERQKEDPKLGENGHQVER
jgi:hypothetical protein